MLRHSQLTDDTPRYDTLVSMLRTLAATRADELAIEFHHCLDTDEGFRISYGELWQSARAAAQALALAGVRQGDRVPLLLPTGINFVNSFFGLTLLGAVPVPFSSDVNVRNADTYFAHLLPSVRDCGATHCIASAQIAETWSDRLAPVQVVAAGAYDATAETTANDGFPEPSPDELALIQYTSGSTSAPKGVMLTHRNLVSNLYAISNALKVTPGIDVAVSWLPLYHDMGLIGMFMSAIYSAVPLHLMPPQAFIRTPKRWLAAISDHKGTITTVPNFAFQLCVRRCEPDGLDLSSLRVLMNGSEPIEADDLTAFADKFAAAGLRPEAITPVYGMAESAVAVTFSADGLPKTDTVDHDQLLAQRRAVAPTAAGAPSKTVVCVGAPIYSQQVRVIDGVGAICDDGTIGDIEIRGPSIMRGYYGRDDLNSRIFNDGWLATGDLGYMKRGELYITGRAKDVIIHNGRNYYPQDIEKLVECHEPVRAGRVIAFWVDDAGRPGMVIMFETRRLQEDDRRQLVDDIRRSVTAATALPVRDVVIVDGGMIPLTTSGKVRRQPAKQMYMELAGDRACA